MNLYDLPASMREKAYEIAKLEGALDYGYYDLNGSHRTPRPTNESNMLRRELWEAHAPPEWVDGNCPHRHFGHHGWLTPQAAEPCFLFWCLAETKKLRVIEELVREAETRYRAWVCMHLKRPAYDPSTYVHRVVWQPRLHSSLRLSELSLTWTNRTGVTEYHTAPNERAVRMGKKMVAEHPGLRNPYEPLDTLQTKLKISVALLIEHTPERDPSRDLLRLAPPFGPYDRLDCLPRFTKERT